MRTLLTLVTGLCACILFNTAFGQTTGIWYGTQYVKDLNYNWIEGHGVGSENQFLSDVNGDGKADAIVYFPSGDWYISYSNGNNFGGYSPWISGHGLGSTSQEIGDVTGDGKSDAVVFFESNGNWYVVDSSSGGYSLWITGHGVGSSKQFLSDVDGDGRDDAIVYFATGDWYVAYSTGQGFGAYSLWVSGHGIGSDTQLVGDVNGDNKSDAVVFFNTNGEWYVVDSLGGQYSFWNSNNDVAGFGKNSTRQFLSDIDFDGKVDAVIYDQQDSHSPQKGVWNWIKAGSNTFEKTYDWKATNWKSAHGDYARSNEAYYNVATNFFLADVHDDSHVDPVVYRASEGIWQVLPGEKYPAKNDVSNYYASPFLANYWEGFSYGFIPEEGTYDSSDESVISDHVTLIEDAQIDFLILDNTNNVFAERNSIVERSLSVCEHLIAPSSNPNTPRDLKFSIAIGGIQFSGNPQTIEDESKHIWNLFLNDGSAYELISDTCVGTSNYYHLTRNEETKPLLIIYAEQSQREAWKASNISKTNSSKFHIQWAQGTVCENSSASGKCAQPANVVSDVNDYFGWIFPEGTVASDLYPVIMPGVDNHLGAGGIEIDRNNTQHYIDRGWKRAICEMQTPEIAIIASFNMYEEETAVASTDTTKLPASKQWNSNNEYWNITKDWNLAYKNGDSSICAN